MTTFEYAVAKFIPDFVRDEPVNIGVIVHEKGTLESHGKFLKDFSEIKKRNPKVNVNALQKILEGYDGKQKIDSEDYLFRLSRDCQFSLRFTAVCGKKDESPEVAVEKLFDEYISLKPQQITA